MAPVVLTAKKLLQKLCKLGWDEEIPEEVKTEWIQWLTDLQYLSNISISRCFTPSGFRICKKMELHCFAYACEGGYGAAIYLRCTDVSGNIHCSFIMGKARLAPLKVVTIPRLELAAAVVAVKLKVQIAEELKFKINDVIFWTDSTTVLQYIRNENRRFKTFIANRLTTIHEFSTPAQWRCVNTELNPADMASRGLQPADELGLHKWIRGPDFLWKSEDNWPEQPTHLPLLPDDDTEMKGDVVVNYTKCEPEEDKPRHKVMNQTFPECDTLDEGHQLTRHSRENPSIRTTYIKSTLEGADRT